MAVSVYFNRIKYTSVSGGTGDFVTSAAVTGFRTPATGSVTDGSIVTYVAFSSDQTQWETGQGAYTAGTTTLARTTVRESSNAGAKVNFTVAPVVALDFQAQDITNLPPIAVNGATIGTNALAVTGTASISGQVFAAAQAIATPSYSFVGQTSTGMTYASGLLKLVVGGAEIMAFQQANSLVYLATGGTLSFAGDAGISRNAAGIIQFGTTAANAAGSWLATNGTLSGALVVSGTADASAVTGSGALQVAGGASIAKRFWIPAITASAGLQTAVLCQSSGGEMIADSVACLASSERFKTILGSAEAGAIDKINRVPIHRWKYKEEGIFQSKNWTREHIGPTAEEIESIDSRLVGYDNEGKARNISQEQLLALAIQAIQEQQVQIEELKARG